MFPGIKPSWLIPFLVTLISVTGCYDENPVSDTDVFESDFPSILDVSPEDGAASINRFSNCGIKFDSPMDTASISENFHLSGGDQMRQWMDSLGHMSGINGMGQNNRDSMMTWMDSIECTGHFEWNDNLDSCVFYPDSMLEANAEHMILLDYGIKNHDGYYVIMDTLEYDACMYHFTTGAQ